MQYTKKSLPIQQLPTGETLAISVHTLESSLQGPTVYLQANLHGPEVFGTALLTTLVQALKKKRDMRGKVIIVPCANPMAVGHVAYNSMVGRWNPQSGTNWNRIFLKAGSEGAQCQGNTSIESKLARTLTALSAHADYVLDIHTTGAISAEHLFTYEWMREDFAALSVPFLLLLEPDGADGAFDESHVVPFMNTLPKEALPKVATWEAHHHSHIDANVLKRRLAQLLTWLDSVVGSGEPHPSVDPQVFKKSTHLHAPHAGFYSWLKKPGNRVEMGEIYAEVYQPTTAATIKLRAPFPFTLLGIYGVAATPAHEQIAWIAY